MPNYNRYGSSPLYGGLGTLANAFINTPARQMLGLRAENLGTRNLANQMLTRQREFDLKADMEDRKRYDELYPTLSPDLQKAYSADRKNPQNYGKALYETGLGQRFQQNLEKFPIGNFTQEDLLNTPAGNMALALGTKNPSLTTEALSDTDAMGRTRTAYENLKDTPLSEIGSAKITDLSGLDSRGSLAALAQVDAKNLLTEERRNTQKSKQSLLGAKVRWGDSYNTENLKVFGARKDLLDAQREEVLQSTALNIDEKEAKIANLDLKGDILRLDKEILEKTKDSKIKYETAKADLEKVKSVIAKQEKDSDYLKGTIKYNDDGTFTALSRSSGKAVQIQFAKGHSAKAQDYKMIQVFDTDGTVSHNMIISPSSVMQTRAKLRRMAKAPTRKMNTGRSEAQQQADAYGGIIVGVSKKKQLSESQKLEARERILKTNTIHKIIDDSQKLISMYGTDVIGAMGKLKGLEEFFEEFNNVATIENKNGNMVLVNAETFEPINSPATRFAFNVAMLRSQARQMLIGEKRISDSEQKLVNEIVDGQQLMKTTTQVTLALSQIDEINESFRRTLTNAVGDEYVPNQIRKVEFAEETNELSGLGNPEQGYIDRKDFPPEESRRPEVLQMLADLTDVNQDIKIDKRTGAYFYFDENGRKRTIKDNSTGKAMRVLK